MKHLRKETVRYRVGQVKRLAIIGLLDALALPTIVKVIKDKVVNS